MSQTGPNRDTLKDTGSRPARKRPRLGPKMSHRHERMEYMTHLTAAQHWQAWLDRYGDVYDTDEERRAAYSDFKAKLAEMRDVFGLENDPTRQ